MERILAAGGSSRGPQGDAGNTCRPSCPLLFLLSPQVSPCTKRHVYALGRKGNSERQPKGWCSCSHPHPQQEAGSGESGAELSLSKVPCQTQLCPLLTQACQTSQLPGSRCICQHRCRYHQTKKSALFSSSDGGDVMAVTGRGSLSLGLPCSWGQSSWYWPGVHSGTSWGALDNLTHVCAPFRGSDLAQLM